MKNICPDDEILADFIENRLPNKKRLKIEKHLSGCDRCLEELTVSRSLVRGRSLTNMEQVPEKVTDKAVHMVTQTESGPFDSFKDRLKQSGNKISSWMFDLLNMGTNRDFCPSPIRGSRKKVSEDLIQLKKKFKKIDTEIEIEKTAKNTANIRIRLPESDKQLKGVRVILKRGEREISSHLLNGGYALFDDIGFGRYNLLFVWQGESIGAYPFEIKE